MNKYYTKVDERGFTEIPDRSNYTPDEHFRYLMWNGPKMTKDLQKAIRFTVKKRAAKQPPVEDSSSESFEQPAFNPRPSPPSY